jgi:hypothetical protein
MNIENPKGRLFAQYIARDPYKETFLRQLGEESPLYESVDILTTSEYGLCFTVPYGDPGSNSVHGACFFPIQYKEQGGNGKVELADKLSMPHFVDSEILNEKIPVSKAFVYSNYFNNLRLQGAKVDDALTTYQYIKDNPTFYTLNDEERRIGQNIRKTRASSTEESSYVVHIYYSATYTGPTDPFEFEVYALSPYTFGRYVADACERNGIELINSSDMAGYSVVMMDVPESQGLKPVYDVLNDICMIAFGDFWDITIQGSDITLLNSPSDGGGAISGGDSGSTGSGVTTGATSDGTKKYKKGQIVEDCDKFTDKSFQTKVESVIDSIADARKIKFGTTDWHDFDDFISTMKDSIEHSFTFEKISDTYTFGRKESGDSHNTSISAPTSATYVRFHNHPEGTMSSPSFQDLLTLCSGKIEAGRLKNTNYIGDCNISFDKDTLIMYCMQPSDTASMKKLQKALTTHVDSTTNNFKIDKLSRKIVDRVKYMEDAEHYAIALAIVSDMLTDGHGIKILRYRTSIDDLKKNKTGRLTNLGFYKLSNKGNVNYVLIKCN